MRVRAVRAGFYDYKRRKEGQCFTLKSEKDFSKRWMEALDESDAPEADVDGETEVEPAKPKKLKAKGKGKTKPEADVDGETEADQSV